MCRFYQTCVLPPSSTLYGEFEEIANITCSDRQEFPGQKIGKRRNCELSAHAKTPETGPLRGVMHLLLQALTDADRKQLRVHPPRGDKDRPMQGVFALRSPMRPNPIGVTAVEVLERNGKTLRIRGIDAEDGSPMVDIKRSRRNAS